MKKYKKYDRFVFPHDDEFCVAESILFSILGVYMYTKPIICTNDNNITCSGNYNFYDIASNNIINCFWKK